MKSLATLYTEMVIAEANAKVAAFIKGAQGTPAYPILIHRLNQLMHELLDLSLRPPAELQSRRRRSPGAKH